MSIYEVLFPPKFERPEHPPLVYVSPWDRANAASPYHGEGEVPILNALSRAGFIDGWGRFDRWVDRWGVEQRLGRALVREADPDWDPRRDFILNSQVRLQLIEIPRLEGGWDLDGTLIQTMTDPRVGTFWSESFPLDCTVYAFVNGPILTFRVDDSDNLGSFWSDLFDHDLRDWDGRTVGYNPVIATPIALTPAQSDHLRVAMDYYLETGRRFIRGQN